MKQTCGKVKVSDGTCTGKPFSLLVEGNESQRCGQSVCLGGSGQEPWEGRKNYKTLLQVWLSTILYYTKLCWRDQQIYIYPHVQLHNYGFLWPESECVHSVVCVCVFVSEITGILSTNGNCILCGSYTVKILFPPLCLPQNTQHSSASENTAQLCLRKLNAALPQNTQHSSATEYTAQLCHRIHSTALLQNTQHSCRVEVKSPLAL